MTDPYWEPLAAAPNFIIPTAQSIAGLGTSVDGKSGLLRVPDTNAGVYEVVPLVYDATIGKWMGPEWALFSTTGSGGYTQGRINNLVPGTGTPNAALNNAGNASVLACGKHVAAGLSLQYRMTGLVVRATIGDLVQIYYTTNLFGGLDIAPVAGNSPTKFYDKTGAAATEWFDSSWITDPNGVAIWSANPTRQHLWLNLRLDNATANRQVEFGGTVKCRWIST